jgi:hypothetical protein
MYNICQNTTEKAKSTAFSPAAECQQAIQAKPFKPKLLLTARRCDGKKPINIYQPLSLGFGENVQGKRWRLGAKN